MKGKALENNLLLKIIANISRQIAILFHLLNSPNIEVKMVKIPLNKKGKS